MVDHLLVVVVVQLVVVEVVFEELLGVPVDILRNWIEIIDYCIYTFIYTNNGIVFIRLKIVSQEAKKQQHYAMTELFTCSSYKS